MKGTKAAGGVLPSASTMRKNAKINADCDSVAVDAPIIKAKKRMKADDEFSPAWKKRKPEGVSSKEGRVEDGSTKGDQPLKSDEKRKSQKKLTRYVRPQVLSSVNQLRGRSAIMATCNSREDRKAVGEFVDLVEAYVDRLYPCEEVLEMSADNEQLSVSERLAKQAQDYRTTRRVVAHDLETQGVLYVTIEDARVDAVRITKSIVGDAGRQDSGMPGSGRLIRLMPLSTVCFASLDDLRAAAKPLVDAYFSEKTKKLTYGVHLKRRNNTTFPRKEAVEALAALVPEPHIVDLNQPDVTLLCEVFKSIAGVAVIPDYATNEEYNLRRLRQAADDSQGCE